MVNQRRQQNIAPLILFDGACALCNASVRFVVDHDRAGRFRFQPLQSAQSQSLLIRHHLDPSAIRSVVLIESRHIYLRSSAVLRICRRLDWPLPLLAGLVAVPAPIRDVIYDWVARNRYRWFGKTDGAACRIDLKSG
jgi:predicted DCC family thiol-disulfide oxidoreductase YuxK